MKKQKAQKVRLVDSRTPWGFKSTVSTQVQFLEQQWLFLCFNFSEFIMLKCLCCLSARPYKEAKLTRLMCQSCMQTHTDERRSNSSIYQECSEMLHSFYTSGSEMRKKMFCIIKALVLQIGLNFIKKYCLFSCRALWFVWCGFPCKPSTSLLHLLSVFIRVQRCTLKGFKPSKFQNILYIFQVRIL